MSIDINKVVKTYENNSDGAKLIKKNGHAILCIVY